MPVEAILAETLSHTTHKNLVYAQQVMQANALHEALIVSDPLHLKRALRIADDFMLDADADHEISVVARKGRVPLARAILLPSLSGHRRIIVGVSQGAWAVRP